MPDANPVLDATDRRIIEVLRTNPRITNKDIATQLQLAEATVAQRIRGMAERDAMRVVAQKHLFSNGYTTLHLMFVNTSERSVSKICGDIGKHQSVVSISQGVGHPSIIVTARCATTSAAHALAAQIGTIRGVTTVEHVFCFTIDKYDISLGNLSLAIPEPESGSSAIERLTHALFRDGRQSNREIARNLGVSEATIRQRIKKLLQAGDMRFNVVCNPRALGIAALAALRITTIRRHTETIIDRLTALTEITFLCQVSGTHDLFAVMLAPDVSALGTLCDNHVLGIPGVSALNVQVLASAAKHQYDLAVFDGQEDVPRRKNGRSQ